MEEYKRKVLFTCGMSDDYMLIITNAPKERIEKWCYRYNEAIENGTFGKEVELFDTLKTQYYVREILDSELDSCDKEDLELIGYDEVYDLMDYTEE